MLPFKYFDRPVFPWVAIEIRSTSLSVEKFKMPLGTDLLL